MGSRYTTVMFNMIRQIAIILLILFPLLASGNDVAEFEEFEKYLCNRSGVEADIKRDVAEAAWYSNILVQLLSGNTEEAIETLSFLLSTNVVAMHESSIKNPCNANEKLFEKILPIIRVVAAANNKTPLPGWNENKEVLKVLEYAIEDNPQHYQDLVKRSNDWAYGIK